MLTHCNTLIVPTERLLSCMGTSLRETMTHKTLVERMMGAPTEETSLYNYFHNCLDGGLHPHRFCGITTEEDIAKRIQEIERLRDEIGQSGFSAVPLIQVSIDDFGRFVVYEGNNRAAICLFLGIESLNVYVVNRSQKWLDFKQQLHDEYQKQTLYNSIPHPDFVDWDIVHYPIRFSWVKDALKKYLIKPVDVKGKPSGDMQNGGFIRREKEYTHLRILDLGCHIGFFSHQLSQNGFDVTGIDQNAAYIAGAQYLNHYYSHFVNFRHYDINEYIGQTQEHYDGILLLNVLYHILRDREKAETTLQKIGAISSAFITDYTPEDNDMTLSEYTDYLQEVTGFTVCEELGTNLSDNRISLGLTREGAQQ